MEHPRKGFGSQPLRESDARDRGHARMVYDRSRLDDRHPRRSELATKLLHRVGSAEKEGNHAEPVRESKHGIENVLPIVQRDDQSSTGLEHPAQLAKAGLEIAGIHKMIER